MKYLNIILITLIISLQGFAQFDGVSGVSAAALTGGSDKDLAKNYLPAKIYIRALDKNLIGKELKFNLLVCPESTSMPGWSCSELIMRSRSIKFSDQFRAIPFYIPKSLRHYQILRWTLFVDTWNRVYSELKMEDVRRSAHYLVNDKKVEIAFEFEKK